MVKILIVHGSPHHGETDNVLSYFEKSLRKYAEAEFTHIYLADEKLEFCRGCLVCI